VSKGGRREKGEGKEREGMEELERRRGREEAL
jgi:hypothetical protein